MSEAKFTKGEWSESGRLIWCGDKIIGSISDTDVKDWDEFHANAHLIAAAPDMYEFLSKLREDLLEEFSQSDEADAISKILAKARGEA